MVNGVPLNRLKHAARTVRAGGVVTHATEGVWGLACDPASPTAMARVLSLKKRAKKRGLILVAAEPEAVELFVAADAADAWASATATWPGDTTWLLPAAAGLDPYLTGGGSRIALRVSAHPACRALARAAGGIIVSTSANPAGRPAALASWQVRRYFGSRIDYVLGGHCPNPGQPSTIRDADSGVTLRGKANG